MRLADLQPGQVFELEGKKYECVKVYPGGRIAVCYELDEKGNRILSEDGFKKRLITDIRFNRQYATKEEKELESLL